MTINSSPLYGSNKHDNEVQKVLFGGFCGHNSTQEYFSQNNLPTKTLSNQSNSSELIKVEKSENSKKINKSPVSSTGRVYVHLRLISSAVKLWDPISSSSTAHQYFSILERSGQATNLPPVGNQQGAVFLFCLSV